MIGPAVAFHRSARPASCGPVSCLPGVQDWGFISWFSVAESLLSSGTPARCSIPGREIAGSFGISLVAARYTTQARTVGPVAACTRPAWSQVTTSTGGRLCRKPGRPGQSRSALLALPSFPLSLSTVRLQRVADAMLQFGLRPRKDASFKMSSMAG
jgi:hypothetical protein